MTRTKSSIIILLLFCSSQIFSQTWDKITPRFSTGDSSFEYWDVSFVSKEIGWYVARTIPSKIFKTSDGGYHWILKTQSTGDLFHLFALDSLHVWIRNGYHLIKFTSDGGQTWDSTYFDQPSDGPLFFFTPQDGIAFGRYLFATSDGGKTWVVKNSNDSVIISSAQHVSFADRKHGWVGGPSPLTTDAGKATLRFRHAPE